MILGVNGNELKTKREPKAGEYPGIGTRFIINEHVFRIIYVKHGKDKRYQRFTAEVVE